MNVHAGRVRSALVRVLIVAGLLAGVLAMHALTGNHDVAMAAPHGTYTQGQSPTAHEAHIASDHNLSLEAPLVEAADPGHTMADLCLAVLTALGLAIVALLTLRCLRAAHPVVVVTLAVQPPAPGRSPPWLRPSLSKLCVLRT